VIKADINTDTTANSGTNEIFCRLSTTGDTLGIGQQIIMVPGTNQSRRGANAALTLASPDAGGEIALNCLLTDGSSARVTATLLATKVASVD
jgi:hypothetical protein